MESQGRRPSEGQSAAGGVDDGQGQCGDTGRSRRDPDRRSWPKKGKSCRSVPALPSSTTARERPQQLPTGDHRLPVHAAAAAPRCGQGARTRGEGDGRGRSRQDVSQSEDAYPRVRARSIDHRSDRQGWPGDGRGCDADGRGTLGRSRVGRRPGSDTRCAGDVWLPAVRAQQAAATAPQAAEGAEGEGGDPGIRAAAGIAAEPRICRLIGARKMIAEHMLKSVQTSPHVTTFEDIDLTELVRLPQRDQEGVHRDLRRQSHLSCRSS